MCFNGKISDDPALKAAIFSIGSTFKQGFAIITYCLFTAACCDEPDIR